MPTFRVGKPRVGLQLDNIFTVPASLTEYIPWDSVTFEDPAGVWDAGDPTRYPITKTGLWLVCLSVWVFNSALVAQVNIETDTTYELTQLGPNSGSGYATVTATLLQEFEAGQAIRVSVQNNDSLDVDVYPFGLTWLRVTRVGPDRWT